MKRLFSHRIPFCCCYYLSISSSSTSLLTFTSSSLLSTTPNTCNSFPTSSFTRMLSSSSSNIGLTEIGSNRKNHGDRASFPNDSSSWREKIEVSIAKSRKIRGGNYVQIATVDPTTLEPRCRTVVFRGFLKPEKANNNDMQQQNHHLPTVMKMITDKRSNKFQEVNNSSNRSINSVEMVWWFSKSSEQYRIRGRLKFVGEDESDEYLLKCRKEQWGNLSDPAREQFYWKDPGLDYPILKLDDDDDSRHTIPTGGRDVDGTVLPPPSNFLLMLLYPSRCDYLRLGDNYRQIDNLLEDGEWKYNRVNP